MAKDKLSIIHFNSRSLYTNFNSIRDYLHTFQQPFNIIAISETWFTPEKGMNFEMEGYEFIYKNRQSKGGCAVAIYVDLNLTFKIAEAMTHFLNVSQYRFVLKRKQISLSVVYI